MARTNAGKKTKRIPAPEAKARPKTKKASSGLPARVRDKTTRKANTHLATTRAKPGEVTKEFSLPRSTLVEIRLLAKEFNLFESEVITLALLALRARSHVAPVATRGVAAAVRSERVLLGAQAVSPQHPRPRRAKAA